MKTGVWAFVFAFILLTSSVYAMPNPAAVYCRELGYSYKILKGDGGERGICILPDRNCGEWEFFAGKCGKEHSYCAKQGYETVEGKGEAVCEFKSSLVKELTSIPVGELMDLEKRMSCDSEPRDRSALAKGSKPPMMAEYNASDFSYWDWKDPPNSTIYGSANFTHFDDSHGWGTDVKNQGGCGSCWAFSAAGAMEAKYNIGRNESRLNPDMSEQYLVSDCNIDPYYSLYQNCCGGWMDLAMDYTMTDGIPDESCLSYVDGSGCSCGGGTCDSNCNYDTGGNCSDTICSDRCSGYAQRLWTITDYTCTWPGPVTNNETKQYLLDYGPLSAAIGFTSYGLYQDTGCIYRCSDDSGTSHGVVLVGYNDTGNATTSYWIIKNSWGTGWPSDGCNMGGYFKLGFNECNFTSEFNFVDVVNAPNFKPFVTINRPGTESNSTRIQFNFTVFNRDASTSTCDLLIDNNITNTTAASNDTPTVMGYSLPEGNYNWSVECWEDDIGIANSSGTRALKVAVPPKITVNSPADTNYSSVITVNVTTNETADWCGWNLNGTENTTMTNASTTSWNGTITQISEGTYRLYVYCNDSFGGMGLNSSVFFTYDIPPEISNVSIIPSIARTSSNATVIAKITDISMDYAYVTGYNTSWDKVYNETNLTQSDNEWYLTFNTSNKTEGLCYLNLTAFDASGNNATWTGNMTINNTLGADDVVVNTSWSTTGNYTILNFSYFNLTLEINTSQELVNTTVGAASYTEDPVGESDLVHLGKYVQAEMSHYVEQNLLCVIIKLFYADSEVSSKGINESTLMLYYYNETTGNWSSEPGGVNTSGNYVWGNTTHFSFYGIFGSNTTTTTTSTTTTVSGGGGSRKTTSTTTSSSTSSTVSTTTTKEAPITGQIIEETTTTVEPVKEEPEIPVLWIAVPVILLVVIMTFVYRAKNSTKKLPPPPVPIVKINQILSSPEKYIGKKVMVNGTVTFSRQLPKHNMSLYVIKDGTGEMHGLSKERRHKGEGMVEGIVRRHTRGVYIEF